MSGLIGFIFVVWFLGFIFAFWIYSSEGEWDYIRGKFNHTYTDGQSFIYAITWYIWFARFVWRGLWALTWWIAQACVYACVEVWHKWRDG